MRLTLITKGSQVLKFLYARDCLMSASCPCRLCILPGDIPYEEHVNNAKYASPDQDFTLALILDERIVENQRELLPKWKGFELDPNAWEPASGLANTGALKVCKVHALVQLVILVKSNIHANMCLPDARPKKYSIDKERSWQRAFLYSE